MGLPEILVIGLMLALNGVFAAYELALASVKPSRLRELAEQKRVGAATALRMKNQMMASLAVVQLGITLAGAIAAALGGAKVHEQLAPYLQRTWGVRPGVASFLALALLVIPLSAVTLVGGELIPKVIGIRNPELVCRVLSPWMHGFSLVVHPIVRVLEWITRLAVGAVEMFLPRPSGEAQSSLAEFRTQVSLLRAGQVIGVQQERIMVEAARLSTLAVREIMLPADDIVMLEADAPLTENIVTAHLDLHTRFPVTERKGDLAGIIGYINFKEMVYLAKTHPQNPVLRAILRPLISFAADTRINEVLRRMVGEHVHLALVRNEAGTVVGMVTQEDIFEELVGEIQDEFDRLPRHVTPSGRQWIVGGGASLGRLRQALNRPELAVDLPGETPLNDWLDKRLGRRLKGGDLLAVDGVSILIRKVRRHKVTEAVLDLEASLTSPKGG